MRKPLPVLLSLLLAFGVLASVFPQIGFVVSRSSDGFDRTQLGNDVPVGDLSDGFPDSGEVDVIIELKDSPTAKVYSDVLGKERNPNAQKKEEAKGAARAQKAKIDAAHKRVLAHLNSPGLNARVLYTVESAYNGIAARLDVKELAKVKAHDDVEAIHALPVHYIDNSTSVPFINGVNAWVAAGGNAGDGVKIGIIDTGVDYLHATFGGPGTAAAYAANNRAIVEPGSFPTAKVVGGRDFAGDAYTGANAPVPDNDPLDCNGHGSHVAGTAGGYGVTAAGTTYPGPFDSTTNFTPLLIGPGVAPKAQIYALKVFGCSGSTGLTTQAINWAVDPNGDGDPSDHLDVINMSLGSNFGSPTDASATASNNAAAAGVIVVASAGNGGDTTFIHGSPASSTRTISVANIVDGGLQASNLAVASPPAIAGNKPALAATFNPPMTLPALVPGSVMLVNDGSTVPFPGSPVGTVGSTADACQALAPGSFAGKIAYLERGGGCGFTFKVKNAQDAGAIAVIVGNNVAGTISMAGVDPTITIPSLSIQQVDGNAMKAQLNLAAVVNVTLQFFSLGDTVSGSTSRGPRRAGAGAKPDLSAPGSSITSTAVGTGTGAAIFSGTSMAAPHVAGSMAILRQLHPTWSVEELKALVMNTANHDLFTGTHGSGSKFATSRVGAGRIDLKDATEAEVVAYSDDDAGAVGVSFGAPEALSDMTMMRTVRVVNRGTAHATFNAAYVPLTDIPGADYSLPDGPTVVVAAGGSATFRVQLSLTRAALKHPRDITMTTVQGGNGRHYLSDETGYVTLTPAAGTSLRVPLFAAPRAASNMSSTHNYVLFTGASGTTTIDLTGQAVNTGSLFPTDDLSVVSAFELQEISPAVIPSTSIASNADLKAIGVTSDYKVTNSVTASTKIYFGIATHGQWSTMTDVTINIFIDRDMNGTDDFQVVTTAPADANGNLFDVFVSARRPAPFTGALALDSFINNTSGASLNTVAFNTNMMAIPVFAQPLGLTTANAKFKYRVATTSRGFGGTIDTSTGYKTYDAANPGFDLTGGVGGLTLYADLPGAALPVKYNKANYIANGSLGVLLLHHHNAVTAHAETLNVQEPSATSVAVDAAAGVYSDPVTLKATVTPGTYLDQTLSGSVQFSVNGNPVGAPAAVTAGVATTTYTVAVGAGSHSITAAFTSSNSAFLSSSGSGTLTVTAESATAAASASNVDTVQVNTPGGTGGPVTLCFDVTEIADGSAGDTTNISSATLTLTPIGGGSNVTSNAATFTGGGVGAARTVCFTLTNLATNVYDVSFATPGPYYTAGGSTILTVYDPSLGFVTGGGTIMRNGYKANFGANIKYLKNGNAQGNLLYIEHRPEGKVTVKSNSMGELVIVGNEALVTGKTNVGSGGNHNFIARIIDNGEPGKDDRFGLRITAPNGTVVTDLTFDPVQLSGGNVQVPKP